MDREKAAEYLTSDDPHYRLLAARFFSRFAVPTDSETLKLALRSESVSWVKSALQKAIDLALLEDVFVSEAPKSFPKEGDNAFEDELYAEAIQEVAQLLVHELKPILAAAQLYARKELPLYDGSRTKGELDRIAQLLSAIEKLNRAATPPIIEQMELSDFITRVAESESLNRTVSIEMAGPTPLVVFGDPALIDIVFRNGLRNAIEATESIRSGKVIVNWNETDRDYWVAILDNGVGLPAGFDRAFEIGLTSKEGHFGMGLALAKRATLSMYGEITLSPRGEGGTAYEFKWPRTLGS